jgi:hypothetical protein
VSSRKATSRWALAANAAGALLHAHRSDPTPSTAAARFTGDLLSVFTTREVR